MRNAFKTVSQSASFSKEVINHLEEAFIMRNSKAMGTGGEGGLQL